MEGPGQANVDVDAVERIGRRKRSEGHRAAVERLEEAAVRLDVDGFAPLATLERLEQGRPLQHGVIVRRRRPRRPPTFALASKFTSCVAVSALAVPPSAKIAVNGRSQNAPHPVFKLGAPGRRGLGYDAAPGWTGPRFREPLRRRFDRVTLSRSGAAGLR